MRIHLRLLILIQLVAVCKSLCVPQQSSAKLVERASTEVVTENTLDSNLKSSTSFTSALLNEYSFCDTEPSLQYSSALRPPTKQVPPSSQSISEKISVDFASFNISIYEAKIANEANVSSFVEDSKRSPENTILHLINTNSFVALATLPQDVSSIECEKSFRGSCEYKSERRMALIEFQLSELSVFKTTKLIPVTPCLSFSNATKGGFLKVHQSIGVAKSLELSLGLSVKMIGFSVSQTFDFRHFTAENIDLSITCEARSGETVQAHVANLSYAEFIPRYRTLSFNAATSRLEEQEKFRVLPTARVLLSNPDPEISCATTTLLALDCEARGNWIGFGMAEI